eukprot:2761161-Lingulodinium_polyedra.AAC.1
MDLALKCNNCSVKVQALSARESCATTSGSVGLEALGTEVKEVSIPMYSSFTGLVSTEQHWKRGSNHSPRAHSK